MFFLSNEVLPITNTGERLTTKENKRITPAVPLSSPVISKGPKALFSKLNPSVKFLNVLLGNADTQTQIS